MVCPKPKLDVDEGDDAEKSNEVEVEDAERGGVDGFEVGVKRGSEQLEGDEEKKKT